MGQIVEAAGTVVAKGASGEPVLAAVEKAAAAGASSDEILRLKEAVRGVVKSTRPVKTAEELDAFERNKAAAMANAAAEQAELRRARLVDSITEEMVDAAAEALGYEVDRDTLRTALGAAFKLYSAE